MSFVNKTLLNKKREADADLTRRREMRLGITVEKYFIPDLSAMSLFGYSTDEISEYERRMNEKAKGVQVTDESKLLLF